MTERPVVFFGGKGGVGKTTIAAAYALESARRGVRTLLVSTDPAHSTSDALGLPLGAEPTRAQDNLDALEIDPERAAADYIADVQARLREVASPRVLAEVEREVEAAKVSPGAEEAALFERFAALMQLAGGEYERVVFDTAPTGHTLRLLSLPELLDGWIDALVGRRRKVTALARMWRNVAGAAAGSAEHDDPVLGALEARQERFRAARAIVTDPARAAFMFVTTAERLPVAETVRAAAALHRRGIAIGGVVVNRLLPAEDVGSFLERGRAEQDRQLARLRTGLREAGLDMLSWQSVPLLPADLDERAILATIAARLHAPE